MEMTGYQVRRDGRDRLRQNAGCKRRGGGDRQRRRLIEADGIRPFADVGEARKMTFHLGVKEQTARGRADARAASMQERITDIGFQIWISLVTAGCDRPSSRAAPVTLPADITAAKASSCRISKELECILDIKHSPSCQ